MLFSSGNREIPSIIYPKSSLTNKRYNKSSLTRDAEFRLQQIRRARGFDPVASDGKSEAPAAKAESPSPEQPSEADSRHIILFDGIKIFDPVVVEKKRESEADKRKQMKEEEVRVVGPEDEKYRLGYGVAGKGVKAPWYMKKKQGMEDEDEDEVEDERESRRKRLKNGGLPAVGSSSRS